MPKAGRRYTPKLKFQVVVEALKAEKTPGQIAKAYGAVATPRWKPSTAGSTPRTGRRFPMPKVSPTSNASLDSGWTTTTVGDVTQPSATRPRSSTWRD